MCEVAGNHDWETPSGAPFPDRTPIGYERSGVGSRRRNRRSRSTPPSAAAPATTTSRISTTGGSCSWTPVPATTRDWPVGDPERPQWLRRVLTEKPGRAKIVFAHHSRLSRGKHGDNENVARAVGVPLRRHRRATRGAHRRRPRSQCHLVRAPAESRSRIATSSRSSKASSCTSTAPAATDTTRPAASSPGSSADQRHQAAVRRRRQLVRHADRPGRTESGRCVDHVVRQQRSTDGDRAEAAQDVRDSALTSLAAPFDANGAAIYIHASHDDRNPVGRPAPVEAVRHANRQADRRDRFPGEPGHLGSRRR